MEAMICPTCKMTMNHHSDKLVYTTGKPEGILEEFHTCPGCGASALRTENS